MVTRCPVFDLPRRDEGAIHVAVQFSRRIVGDVEQGDVGCSGGATASEGAEQGAEDGAPDHVGGLHHAPSVIETVAKRGGSRRSVAAPIRECVVLNVQ